MRPIPLLLLLAAAAAGCAPGRSVLTLAISADPPLASVDSLEIVVTDAAHSPPRSAVATVTVQAGLPPERTFSFVLPAEISGMVTVAVTAHGGGGALGTVSKQVAVAPSEVASASLSIGRGGGSGLGAACNTPAVCPAPLDSCTVGVADVDFSGGYCTTVCDSGQREANCTVAGGDCEDVAGLRLCLARCHPAAGMGCRDGYQCCAGGAQAASGWCAPPTSNVCIPRG
jgi:hypothetical protein